VIKSETVFSNYHVDIDRSHRLGRAGPIIIKFSRHNTKQLVYVNKKKLKGKKFLITEFLTTKRKECMSQLKDLYNAGTINSYWSMDG